jgi:predicted ATPase/DNA-binding XRE family transcriptional regulator
MTPAATRPFGAHLKALRETAGFTQEELATIAGLSVHAVSALERGERRRPHPETVRSLAAALDLTGAARDALVSSARGLAPGAGAHTDPKVVAPLPVSPTPLLGREADVLALRQLLADPGVRLVTLVGPGGAGKTRLALEMARTVQDDGSRVACAMLAATRNVTGVAAAIADALGLSEVPAADLARHSRAACDGRPTLLVVDNFEHVMEAAPLIADVAGSCGPLRLLVTSRSPLRLRGEREFVVGPLSLEAGAAPTSVADLARVPAVRLFLERVRDVRPDFRLTLANGPAVLEICRRLDALPLALELAAPWMKALAPEELLTRLTHVVLRSTAGPRDLPARQQTINATVAWSYQLLGADEQRAFRYLGALPGRFPIDAAAAVLGATVVAPLNTDEASGVAASLIDKSLLSRAPNPAAVRPQYQMLETVRAFALTELTSAGERDDAMERLARYCVCEASLAAKGLVGPTQVEWLDRVRDDLDSYRGALTWLIERDRAVEASNIAWSLGFYWLIRGHAAEGLAWYERILSLPSLPPPAELRALTGAALMRYTRGELDNTRALLTQALALHVGPSEDDLAAVTQAVNLLGHVERALGHMDAARAHLSSSLERFRALAIPWGIGSSLTGLATMALQERPGPGALGQLEEAAVALRDAGPWFQNTVLFLRAILAVRGGKPDEALAHLRRTLAHIRELHDKFAFVFALIPLAAAAALKGDHAWVARILGARDSVIERTGIVMSDTAVRDLRERAERDARSSLGPERWAAAYAAGRAASIDSARDLHQFVAEAPA